MSAVSIRVEGLGVYYRRWSGFLRKDRFWALEDVSFEVARGETFGVIGRNGAGKSTLLSVLSGICAPDRGSVELFGGRASLLSLQVGFVKELSGRDNALLGALLMGVELKTARKRLNDVVRFAGLEETIDQPFETYSAGMKARLGFSVAFHAQPDIILLDEVLGVGDAAFKKKSSQAMKELISSHRTVVLVSHNSETILEHCDRVLWLERGRVKQVGRPEDVVAEYEQTVK
ncbi:lipopolysaccharide transport system ATP-binding protein [Geothermobacter ehrlichii]|uniref:Lipopolysaccharide transport system ATP-binding protein n=1 Tax=Geothermobacter ehrlichii TaxID=213224 RepID=A0A5D3WMI9_9BACT|nr:ABC transporter ATP-binding protein [Geothermobacter ehrlichii]TYP00071.1 lipopolysaccharide transport system ATP-binding protein [Geothermobacter ehrlichii]